MEDFELTKKPDLDIFDRQFPVRLESDPIYDPTKMTIIQGTDGVLDDLFSYQVYNKLKNHWRLDVEPFDKKPGMIWSDLDNDKLFHYGNVAGEAWDEVLQLTRSSDVTPEFLGLLLAEYIRHDEDADTYIQFEDNSVRMRAGGIDLVNIGGKVFINDDVDTKMTIGLTINQAGNDDEIFAFKSSDVVHGCTDHAEEDTFGHILKQSSSAGGVKFRGFSELAVSMVLEGVATNDNTDKDATARGVIELIARKISGSDYGNLGADANMVAMREGDNTRWLLDRDGDTWQSGNITMASATSTLTGGTIMYLEAGADGIRSATIYADESVSPTNMRITPVDFQIVRSTAGNRKHKDKIKDFELDTSLIYKLRPVSFNSKCKVDDKKKRFHSLIADEVLKIFPDAVEYNKEKEPEEIDYRLIQMVMLKEIQNLNDRIKQLESN